jgi:hypothetical protein
MEARRKHRSQGCLGVASFTRKTSRTAPPCAPWLGESLVRRLVRLARFLRDSGKAACAATLRQLHHPTNPKRCRRTLGRATRRRQREPSAQPKKKRSKRDKQLGPKADDSSSAAHSISCCHLGTLLQNEVWVVTSIVPAWARRSSISNSGRYSLPGSSACRNGRCATQSGATDGP